MLIESSLNFSFYTFPGVEKAGKGIWRNEHVIKLKIASYDEIAVDCWFRPDSNFFISAIYLGE